jgi:hypothetical protein
MIVADDEIYPVFIHSLFRSGSTYIFNVFRQSPNYWCYQEPFNEFLIHLNGNVGRLLDVDERDGSGLRHPKMIQPYFWEFYQVKEVVSGLFRKSFSFDDFFIKRGTSLPSEQLEYITALIDNAKGRPVLQFCRSTGRMGPLKASFPGIHIHLWREPRNQWWSFKINDFFDPAIQLILNAKQLPEVLRYIKEKYQIIEYHDDDIENEFENARINPISSTSNYLIFYAVWLFSYLESESILNFTISIDRLSADASYRDEITKKFTELGAVGLDFKDCSVPSMIFKAHECEWYLSIENQVHKIFEEHGFEKNKIDMVVSQQELIQNIHTSVSAKTNDAMRDAVRLRKITLGYIEQCANLAKKYQDRINRVQRLASEVEQINIQILQSKSWQITAPLRWAASKVRLFKQHSILDRTKAVFKSIKNIKD